MQSPRDQRNKITRIRRSHARAYLLTPTFTTRGAEELLAATTLVKDVVGDGAGMPLDDVFAADVGAVPEPASLSLLAMGLLALLRGRGHAWRR